MKAALFSATLIFLRSFAASAAAEPDWQQVEKHATELLQQYVKIASVNPPADTSGTAKLLQSELTAVGLKATLYQSGQGGKTNLMVRLPGRDRAKRPLLLLNHMDVVPVDASRWQDNPFSAEIKDGLMWGRGTLDMKSTGIMQLTAFLLLKQLSVTPARDIVFLATCDEETGGVSGATWMIQNHWDELNPEYVLDEGGVGSNDVYSNGKLTFGISVADKQVLWLRVRATGTSGHGSQPIADNANDLLMRAVAKAKEFPPSKKADPIVQEMRQKVGTFASNKFMNAIQQNTISVTSLRSGLGDPPKANVIPSIAEATLDCRLLPGQNADEFISEIKARVNDPHITVEEISPKPDDPSPSRSDTALYAAVKRALETENPGVTVMPMVVPYGTDGQKFRMRGVAAYGIIPMIMDAKTLGTMHSDSEHISLEQFRHGLHVYFNILRSEW